MLQIYTKENILNLDRTVIKNHTNNSIISKLSGKNSSSDIYLYTNNQNPYSKIFERDTNCWLNGVTNIGCWNSAQLDGSPWYAKTVTLISPRHVYASSHYLPCGLGWVDANTGYVCPKEPIEILFTDSNNNVITRKIIKYIRVSAGEVVGLLDKDVPSSFPFAKVLPPYFHNYLPLFNKQFYEFPTILSSIDQLYVVCMKWTHSNFYVPGSELYKRETIFISKLKGIDIGPSYPGSNTFNSSLLIDTTPTSSETLSSWFINSVPQGSSSRPLFLIMDNELVLIGIWYSGGSTETFISSLDQYQYINESMQKLGGGYQLTPIDLEYIYNKYKT